MKKIIPFKNNLKFKTNISEITSISLENSLSLKKDIKLIKYLFINMWFLIYSCVFTSKKDIYDIRYPGLCMYDKFINDEKHYVLKQFFYPYSNNRGYFKKLIREKDNYHYE